ncbi:MAG: ABC transporter ATP-binding protein [Deltaproteobacteria bacterium]|nr:ABC transporter ATP-binding protein [Deltaproteobacteria bacterium]
MDGIIGGSQADRENTLAGPQVDPARYAIDIVSLSKRFKRATAARSGYTTLKTSLVNCFTHQQHQTAVYTTAIKDLTLRIPQGLSVGIIGRNGSGKSTLLKLITGIYKPDIGTVKVNGRVAALIELGAGFHPDFSGRENLHLGGVLHGLSRKQINDRFEEIVRFAELEDVIDDPVRTYSSGMFMRLGFSLAIHTDPDVLLIDEVLAVGDAAFVTKCQARIADLRKQGKTLLLVSHDLGAIERWSDEALWLQAGEVWDRGDPRRVIDHYREFVEKGEEAELFEKERRPKPVETVPAEAESVSVPGAEPEQGRWGSREIEISAVRICGADGTERLLLRPEDRVRIEIEYLRRESVSEAVFGIGISRTDGVLIHGSNTDIEKLSLPPLSPKGTVIYEIDRLGLLDGHYLLDVAVHRSDGYAYDYHKGALKFAVRSALKQVGVCVPSHRWIFE